FEYPQQVESARECERYGQQDVSRFDKRVVSYIQRREDDKDDDGDHDHQPLLSPHLIFVLSAPCKVITRRKLNLLKDRFVRLLDNAADVAAANVQENGGTQEPVFALDHRGPLDLSD